MQKTGYIFVLSNQKQKINPMAKKIFINLPVADLPASMNFYSKIGFATKAVGDAKTSTSVINSISVDSLDEVNTMADAALKAGGSEPHELKDYGFMQQRSFTDIDGHHWEVLYMDMSKFPG
jgi:predicted lactoylglutathione lyase